MAYLERILAPCQTFLLPVQQGPFVGIRFHMKKALRQGYQMLPTQPKYKHYILKFYRNQIFK